jgi:predicted DNA-binding transcriptional regulator YafY
MKVEKSMNGSRQITRQLDILRTLQARQYGVRAKELAEEFGVTVRTIQRDLGDLGEAGFPLYNERRGGQHVYWYLMQSKELPSINFPLLEVASLLFLEDMADALEGTPFKDHLHAALRRISLTLPEPALRFLRRAAHMYTPFVRGGKSYVESSQIIEDLNQALLERRVCRVTYQTADSKICKTYPIEPLRLFYFRGGLYLISRVPAYNQLITQAVERIRALELTEERFEVPQDLSVEERLEHSFGVVYEEPFDVKIQFSREQAPYIRERIWHPTQQIEEQEDGSLILSLHAGGRYEIKSWILSYGATARVLEPDWLRDQVAEELRTSLESYQNG